MFVRKFVITDEYRGELAERVKMHKENIEEDLITLSSYRAKVIDDILKLNRDYAKAQREQKKLWNELWTFFTEKSEFVPESEKEKKEWIERDEKMAQLQEMIDDMKNDISFLTTMNDVFTGKGYSLKSFIEYQKFLHGE